MEIAVTSTTQSPAADEFGQDRAVPVEAVLSRLDHGEIRGHDLSPHDRHRCVEHLTDEGQSAASIAARLGVSERTVHRERAAIRAQGALKQTPALRDELMGEFQRLTQQSVQRLTQLSHDPKTPAYARLWAEEAIARIYRRFVESATALGYLDERRSGGSSDPFYDGPPASLIIRSAAEIHENSSLNGPH